LNKNRNKSSSNIAIETVKVNTQTSNNLVKMQPAAALMPVQNVT